MVATPDYRSAHMDALADQIRVEMDHIKRKELCSEAQNFSLKISPTSRSGSPTSSPFTPALSATLALSPTGDSDFLVSLRPSN
jgi:hypothetical protein